MTPLSIGIGCENIGPAYAKVWNSPRSPHGSIVAGRSREQRRVELAARERSIEHGGFTHVMRARQAARDHLAGERGRVRAEQRKERRQAAASELLLAIPPDVLEEEIAERDVREAVRHVRRLPPPPWPARRPRSGRAMG